MTRRADPSTFLSSWVRFRICRMRDEGYEFWQIAQRTGLPKQWVRSVITHRCPDLYRMSQSRKLAWRVYQQYIKDRPQAPTGAVSPIESWAFTQAEIRENHRRAAKIAEKHKVSVKTIWRAIGFGRQIWDRRHPGKPHRL